MRGKVPIFKKFAFKGTCSDYSLKPLLYKAFLSMTEDGFVIKKDENKRTGRLILLGKRDKYI